MSRCTSLPSASNTRQYPICSCKRRRDGRCHLHRSPEAEALLRLQAWSPRADDARPDEDVLTEVGLVLDHVVITELKDQLLRRAAPTARRQQLRHLRRPSDAIALAIRAGATIYAEERCSTPKDRHSQREDIDEPGEAKSCAQFHEFIEGSGLRTSTSSPPWPGRFCQTALAACW